MQNVYKFIDRNDVISILNYSRTHLNYLQIIFYNLSDKFELHKTDRLFCRSSIKFILLLFEFCKIIRYISNFV